MAKHQRDELLYLAKLAEQCERYDGKYSQSVDSKLTTLFATPSPYSNPHLVRP